jgi:choice-of-anchor C domain-containing protein
MAPKLRASVLVVSILASAGSHAATNLVTNGSFESDVFANPFGTLSASNAITGWSLSGGTVDAISTYWTAQQGANSLDLFGNDRSSTLSQSITTMAGQLYKVSYWQSYNPDKAFSGEKVVLSVNNGPAFSQTYTNSPVPTRSAMAWQQASTSFTATGASTLLTFSGTSTDTACCWGPAFDNVSVTAVPEPGEWALLMAGLSTVGLIVRRRRNSLK